MIYKCTNKKCELYNKEINETVHYSYTRYGRIDNKIKCPSCGKERKTEEKNNGVSLTVLGRPNVPSK